MPEEIRLWEVHPDNPHGPLQGVNEVRLDLEARLQSWVRRDPSVLADDLLVIGQEVPTDVGGFIDLLALDAEGTLVVVELKRGQTPREVAAQALDYGAWAHRASGEEIKALATQLLGRSLDDAFREQFGTNLPDHLGESHRMLIVATRTDGRTERIVSYLSEVYNVDINVLSFSFFQTADGREILGRTHLLEPDQVEQRSQRRPGSKRLPNLTRDQLRAEAERRGLEDAYDRLVDALNGRLLFGKTRSAASFRARLDGGRKATFNIVTTESSAERGLKVVAYMNRLATVLGTTREDVRWALPADMEPYAWQGPVAADDQWRGDEGYMQPADVDTFVAWLNGQPAGGTR